MRPLTIVVSLVLVLGLAALLVRTFVHPFVSRGELEQLFASIVYNDSAVASQVCGQPVGRLMAGPPVVETDPWVPVQLHSWQPFFARTGTISARVTGVGVEAQGTTILTPTPCVAVLTLNYEGHWEDNGRSMNFRVGKVGAVTVSAQR